MFKVVITTTRGLEFVKKVAVSFDNLAEAKAYAAAVTTITTAATAAAVTETTLVSTAEVVAVSTGAFDALALIGA